MAYLDANATEILRPEARAAVIAALGLEGNPASIHAAGRAARRMLEQARMAIGAAYGSPAAGVVFCSGATEANAMAIASLGRDRRVLFGATEHDAVRAACAGGTVLPVHGSGLIDLEALEAELRAGGPALVCLMLANNETGVLHPIETVSALCRAHGARLHVDAVQAAGRVKLNRAQLGADSMALSGHKLGGPKGAGALLLAPGLQIEALIAGGGQERGQRGGTQALPAIAGFAAAVKAAGTGPAHLAVLRDRIEQAAVELGAVVCGTGPRLANTTCLALRGISAETQVITLDLAGYAVSAGAACSSGKVTASHVLEAMGLGGLAGNAIRVSLPWNFTESEADGFIAAYAAMVERLRPRPRATPAIQPEELV